VGNLEMPAVKQTERIDFISVIEPDAKQSRCIGDIDTIEDIDRDIFVTGLFAAEPNLRGGPRTGRLLTERANVALYEAAGSVNS
jgi:hypothetical protein